MDTIDNIDSKDCNFYIARFEVQVLGKELIKKRICLRLSTGASFFHGIVDFSTRILSYFPDIPCARKYYDYLVKHLVCPFGVSFDSTSRCFAF